MTLTLTVRALNAHAFPDILSEVASGLFSASQAGPRAERLADRCHIAYLRGYL